MSHHQAGLGATFIPGGQDDYWMPSHSPEVISPAPQRLMPEVPENIQDNLARLEIDGNSARSPIAGAHVGVARQPMSPVYGNAAQNGNAPFPKRQSSMATVVSSNPSPPSSSHDYHNFSTGADVPYFSPFPKIPNRPPNVPPSDDEKEAVLENARVQVLNSNDPEMQLAWAQDALSYVDAAILHEERIAETQPPRPCTPQVEHQLRVDAMNIVSFLADQHHPKAEFMRGMWLEFGKFGMRMDKKEAFRCYSRAADKGYARAEYRIGMQFESSNDPIKAIQHYKRGSEMGDSASNYRLGMMTLLGQHGQPQDFARGVQLIQQAAATADENAPQGAYVLGMLQARELPQIQVPEMYLPYNEAEARRNIEKAAYLGFSKAQLKMGAAYELCSLGCEFNPALSLHYNALASRQGEIEADMAISKWFLCGYEGVFPKNEELAYTYAARAAQGGLPTAEFAMGYFYEIGMYVPVNLEKAMEWYEKAARKGNKDAESRIEGISMKRTLSKKDHENVAISRIKSQYGSKRGGRPERFRTTSAGVPAMPTISDHSMPNSPATTLSSPMSVRPPRSSSTAPYPLSDKPPSAAGAPYDRPATVAPYPTQDGPPMAPGHTSRHPSGGFFVPELRSSSSAAAPHRPSSAFTINPNLTADQGGPPGGRMASAGAYGPPPRAATTLNDPAATGRRVASATNTRPAPGAGYRMPAGPSVDLGYQAPSPYDGVSAGGSGGGRSRLQKPPPQHAGGGMDIGFQAPLPKQRHHGQGQGQLGQGGGAMSPPPARQSTAQVLPGVPGRGGTPVAGTGNGSRPGSAGRPVSSSNAGGRPSMLDPGPGPTPGKTSEAVGAGKTAGTGKTTTGTGDAAAAGSKPGSSSGPKTFEDMGIPVTKSEGDCVIM